MLPLPLILPGVSVADVRALSSAAALTPDGVHSLRARLWKTRVNDGDASGSRGAGSAPSDRQSCIDSADEAMVRPLHNAMVEQSRCLRGPLPIRQATPLSHCIETSAGHGSMECGWFHLGSYSSTPQAA